MKASQLLVPSALATSVLSIALLAIALATGVSQEHFEVVAPAAEFARHLVASAGPLKLDFAVDLVFIAAYTLFALAWSAHSVIVD